MIYLDILIISIMIILWFIIKNIIRYIRLLCILYLVSGYLMITLGFFVKIIIKRKIVLISINNISSLIFKMFTNRGLWLLLWGGLLLVIYVVIVGYKYYKNEIWINYY